MVQAQRVDKTDVGKFLGRLPAFAGLPPADMETFISSASVRHYKKQQTIFNQGDEVDRLFVVMDGWVKLFGETFEGEEAVMAIYARGDVFGETAIFSDGGYPACAEAAEETWLLEIPAAALKERARTNSDIMARMMQIVSRKMRDLQIENEHLSVMNAPQRVGCLLLQLSGGMIGSGGTFTFPYDKSLAAMRLGMKAETFSRALAQLQPVGVTVNGGEVVIDSFSALADYCCTHCIALPEECCKGTHAGCAGCPGQKLKSKTK